MVYDLREGGVINSSGTVSNCTMALAAGYPGVKRIDVTFDLTVTSVSAGTLGSHGSPGTTMTTMRVPLRLDYTEMAGAVVFDKVLVNDVVPDGMPPETYTSGSNHTSVTESLTQ